jgi:hypothetical protein
MLSLLQVRYGRLPAHLLLSDRDFDENDYEALLALDDGVENRKVGKYPVRTCGLDFECSFLWW